MQGGSSRQPPGAARVAHAPAGTGREEADVVARVLEHKHVTDGVQGAGSMGEALSPAPALA